MQTALITHPTFLAHASPAWHPERPERLSAVMDGAIASGTVNTTLEAAPVEMELLSHVHSRRYIAAIEAFCESGGGNLDADTYAVAASWDAAIRAAGSGPQAVGALLEGQADVAFCAVRPPGHHAVAGRAMGFCLFNNVAVTAEYLIEAGFRVAVVDWDVHHGNGTQDLFVDRKEVLYISIHEYPFYPGSGWLDEVGYGPGLGTVLNLPLPSGTAGDVFRAAFGRVIQPVLAQYQPEWILVSAGYDAHALDPLADLRLEGPDYAFMASAIADIVPAGRTIYFLEGGYHLDGIRSAVEATLRGAAGEVPDSEPVSKSPESAWRNLDLMSQAAKPFWKIG